MSTLPYEVLGDSKIELAATARRTVGSDIATAVREFVSIADKLGAPRPAADELLRMTHQVAAFAGELFPGKVLVETDVDPGIPDDVCLLLHVEATGAAEEIVSRNDAWARRVWAVAREWPGLFCLSIDARS